MKLCTLGTHISWCQFLLNEIVQDASDAHEMGKPFHYSWLLLLISFVAWSDPQDYQGLDLLVTCQGEKYQNLFYEKDLKDWHEQSNIEFCMHGEAIRNQVKNMSRLDDTTVHQFHPIAKFEIVLTIFTCSHDDSHNVKIYQPNLWWKRKKSNKLSINGQRNGVF